MTPYYADELVTLYCGDARLGLPFIEGDFDAVITDPVWPGAPDTIPGHDEDDALMRTVSSLLVGRAKRLVVHLGSTCDPRWLSNVDARWPFLMSQQLEYAMPSFRGRSMLNDIAFTFGEWPTRAAVKASVQPGRITCTRPREIKPDKHPAARAYQHVAGLIRWWATGRVLDPFAGSGTTLLAAKLAGWPCVGIEREERFCEVIVSRLTQRQFIYEDADIPVRLPTHDAESFVCGGDKR